MSKPLDRTQLISYLELLRVSVPRQPNASACLLTLLQADDLPALGHAGGVNEWLVDRISVRRLSEWREAWVASPLVFPEPEPRLQYLGRFADFLRHHSNPLFHRSESGDVLVGFLAPLPESFATGDDEALIVVPDDMVTAALQSLHGLVGSGLPELSLRDVVAAWLAAGFDLSNRDTIGKYRTVFFEYTEMELDRGDSSVEIYTLVDQERESRPCSFGPESDACAWSYPMRLHAASGQPLWRVVRTHWWFDSLAPAKSRFLALHLSEAVWTKLWEMGEFAREVVAWSSRDPLLSADVPNQIREELRRMFGEVSPGVTGDPVSTHGGEHCWAVVHVGRLAAMVLADGSFDGVPLSDCSLRLEFRERSGSVVARFVSDGRHLLEFLSDIRDLVLWGKFDGVPPRVASKYLDAKADAPDLEKTIVVVDILPHRTGGTYRWIAP